MCMSVKLKSKRRSKRDSCSLPASAERRSHHRRLLIRDTVNSDCLSGGKAEAASHWNKSRARCGRGAYSCRPCRTNRGNNGRLHVCAAINPNHLARRKIRHAGDVLAQAAFRVGCRDQGQPQYLMAQRLRSTGGGPRRFWHHSPGELWP